MILISYLMMTTVCTYAVMKFMPLLLKQENWTIWKFFLCVYLDIAVITLAYLLVEQFSGHHFGVHFHSFMNEEHTFIQNYLSMLTFDCIVGTVVCAVIYFFIISNEMNLLLQAKESLRNRVLPRKLWPEAQAQTPDEMITLSGRTKDSLMLKPNHILYMEVLGNYVDVHYLDENGKISRKTIRTTIQHMEDALEDYPAVIRCHRTYIVNVSYVEKANTSQQGLLLILKNVNREIPVSRTYKKNFRPFLEINRFFSVFI
ncbi:MAG: LytTR family transcriptional regulator [Tannerella sp.]|nr:LytTR family transcriptional regulator [Tannerella sp.]